MAASSDQHQLAVRHGDIKSDTFIVSITIKLMKRSYQQLAPLESLRPQHTVVKKKNLNRFRLAFQNSPLAEATSKILVDLRGKGELSGK